MISPNGIKAIFFDLDGTLRHSVPSGGEVFTDYVMTLGLQVNEEARLRAMRWEHLYWANSVDLRDDLLAHSGETENFWIEYSRRRLVALGASPAVGGGICAQGLRSTWASSTDRKVLSLRMCAESCRS